MDDRKEQHEHNEALDAIMESLLRVHQSVVPDQAVLTRALNAFTPEKRQTVQTVSDDVSIVAALLRFKVLAPAFAVLLLVIVGVAQTAKMGNSQLAVKSQESVSPKDSGVTVSTFSSVPAGDTTLSDGQPSAPIGAPLAAKMAVSARSAAPVATGKVDDIMSTIISEAQNDTAVLNDASADTGLLGVEGQTLQDYGTTYAETQF